MKEAVARAIQTYGRLDGVCLNAAIFGPCHRIAETQPEKWIQGIQINLLSHLTTVGLLHSLYGDLILLNCRSLS